MTKQAQENEKAYLSSLTSVYLAMLASVYLLYPGLGGYQEIVTQKWETYLILSGTYIVAMGIFKLDLTLARVRGVVSLKREGRPMGPGVKFCVSDFRQSQEWALENRADWRLNPFITHSHSGQNGMRAGAA